MGSHAGSHPFGFAAAYCATKAAVEALADVIVMKPRPSGDRTALVTARAVSNGSDDDAVHKIGLESIAEIVHHVVVAPRDRFVGRVEILPARPVASPLVGMGTLQAL